jgi:type II secretory pathway pseudopilin PulG
MRRRAFTLLETVATFVIVGVLLGAGFVAFNRTETGVTDERYQIELRQFASSFAAYEESRGYFPLDAATLRALEPGVTLLANGTSTKSNEYALATGTDALDVSVTVLGLAVLNHDANRCFTLTQPPTDAETVTYRSGVFTPTAEMPCSGTSALLQSGQAW